MAILRMAHVRENGEWREAVPTDPTKFVLAQSMDGETAVYVWWLEEVE